MGKIITVGTISLEQTTPSIRAWKDLPLSVYNRNGRVSSVEIEAQLSTLHSVNVQCVDIPRQKNCRVDKIGTSARILWRTNASLLRNEKYVREEIHDGFFHSDSNRQLLTAWLRGEERKSQLADHIPTMRLARCMAMSIKKAGHPITFDI